MMGCPCSGGAGLDDDEGKRSIEDWVDNIGGDIYEAAEDNDISTGEVLIRVVLSLMELNPGTPEEMTKAAEQFIAAIREKAAAS